MPHPGTPARPGQPGSGLRDAECGQYKKPRVRYMYRTVLYGTRPSLYRVVRREEPKEGTPFCTVRKLYPPPAWAPAARRAAVRVSPQSLTQSPLKG